MYARKRRDNYLETKGIVVYSNKSIRNTLCLAITALALISGCGGKDASESDTGSVVVKKDGQIVSVMYEDFTESYYDVYELKTMAEDEISSFNLSAGDGSVVLDSVDKDDDHVKMVVKFKSPEIYAHFSDETLMYETVEEARQSGNDLSGEFKDSDGSVVTSDTISALSGEHVVITSNKTSMSFPYKVKYVSAGAVIKDSKTVDLSQTDPESLACIILSK